MSIFAIAFSLFLIIDPIGNIPFFAAYLKKYSTKRQCAIILRELIIALIVMVIFEFIGDYILIWLHIDIPTIQISGGIILFLIALGMIFPAIRTGSSAFPSEEEPFIVPLAIPLVAGPTMLAAIMVYTRQNDNRLHMLYSIFIAWICATLILIFSPLIKSALKAQGLTACERLMGLVLTFMSVQMFLEGLMSFISS